MRNLSVIFNKEFKAYWYSFSGWVTLSFVTIVQGLVLSSTLKIYQNQAFKENLLYSIFNTQFFYAFFLALFPLITMKLFSDERKSGTLETLITSPIRLRDIILGKFLAACCFYLLLWTPNMIFFILLNAVSDGTLFSLANFLGTYLALGLIGFHFVALGLFCSSLTSTQITAAMIALGLLSTYFFTGWITKIWGHLFAAAPFFDFISFQQHLSQFCNGQISTSLIIFHLSMVGFYLFLIAEIHRYQIQNR